MPKDKPVCPYCGSDNLWHPESHIETQTHYIDGLPNHIYTTKTEVYHCEKCRIYIQICNDSMDVKVVEE
jgi:hypothetical protein